MRLPDDESKYSHNWKYYEAAVWMKIDGSYRFVRQGSGKTGHRKSKMYSLEELEQLSEEYDDVGILTSVYAYNSKDIEKATRFAPLFFDFDAEDILDSIEDAKKLVAFFSSIIEDSAIRIFFSGNKGFHVEIEPLAMGIAPAEDLKTVFRMIAETLIKELGLTTLDLRVYDHRRMWRKPYSKHQKSGLYKIPITKSDLFEKDAKETLLEKAKTKGLPEDIPEQKLNIRAAAWYKNFVYQIEKEEQLAGMSIHDRLKILNQQGSGMVNQFNDDDLEFDPVRLFESCPSIMRLWKKAETMNHLEHEERLFLCSILTYSEEAINYLYAILSCCSDFDPDRSRHHINDWIARREAGIGGRPYTCKAANEKGVGCGSCDLEPRKKYKRVGSTVIETEEMAQPSPIRFAYKRKEKK